ncbi:MAG: hypothetical protein MUO64_00960 [Anaerolineales bacterium]|nr:hypothetical protein [Anaerolineales bacterium]
MAFTINHRKLSDRILSGSNLFRLSLLILLVVLSACGKKAATPAPVVAQEQPSSLMAQPVAGVALPAGALGPFFPQSGSGFTVEPVQEQAGYAETSLKMELTEVARLSIRDAAQDPATLAAFNNRATQIGSFPMLETGSGGTAILVANRFLVWVQAVAPDFAQTDREYWLQQFNLAGLAGLK